MINKLSALSLCILSTSLLVCQDKNYCPQQLTPLTEKSSDYYATKQGVTIGVRCLDYDNTYKIFGDRVSKIFYHKNPLTPIQISVTNNSHETLLIENASIGLKLELIKNIQSRLYFMSSSMKAAICLGCALPLGLLGFGLAGVGLIAGLELGCPTVSIAGIAIGGGMCAASLGLLIATSAIFVQKKSEHVNATIDDYIEKTALGNKAVKIPAGCSVDILVFAKDKNVKDNFDIMFITDENNQKLTFNVQL